MTKAESCVIYKRNANAFSLNAIVDVHSRRRRHEMILLNISETTRARNFKFDSLYICTQYDVTSYFWSAGNRIKVFILGHVRGHDFLITVQPILKMFTVLTTVIQWLRFLFCNLLDIFAP